MASDLDYKKGVKSYYDDVLVKEDKDVYVTLVNTSPSFVVWLCNRMASIGLRKILDFGGGSVIIGKQLAEHFKNIDYTCYDLSEKYIQKCNKQAKGIKCLENSSVRFIQGESLETLSSIPENSVDAILFFELFANLSSGDIKKSLELAYDCIKPGGRVFIIDVDAYREKRYGPKRDLSGKRIKFRPLDFDKLIDCIGSMDYEKILISHVDDIPGIKEYENFAFFTDVVFLTALGDVKYELLRGKIIPMFTTEQSDMVKAMEGEISKMNEIDDNYSDGNINATEAEAETRKIKRISLQENQEVMKNGTYTYFLIELGKSKTK